jgi:hypothetical protein
VDDIYVQQDTPVNCLQAARKSRPNLDSVVGHGCLLVRVEVAAAYLFELYSSEQ